MTEETQEKPRGRGRPKGSKDAPKKLKLKPSPKTAKEDFKKKYSSVGLVAIFGIDEFTKELVYYMWDDPTQEFVVTSPIEQETANFTREIGSRPYSMYRYDQVSPLGFIEEGHFPVVVVAEEYWDKVSKLPNPHDVKLICLSHWEK